MVSGDSEMAMPQSAAVRVLHARMGRSAILALALLCPCPSFSASEQEAQTLVVAFNESFAWACDRAALAMLVDADARVAFHKIRDGRPLAAWDPVWQANFPGFRSDYVDAVVKARQQVKCSTPEFNNMLGSVLSKELSSEDARLVLEFLTSAEFRKAITDKKFQAAWLRMLTVYTRFRDVDLPVIFSKEELSELSEMLAQLEAEYPVAFATLMPFESGSKRPAVKRFFSTFGALIPAGGALSPAERDALNARIAAVLQPVNVKWKKTVTEEGR